MSANSNPSRSLPSFHRFLGSSPAKFVLLRLVSQVLDQCGDSIRQLSIPIRPRLWAQGLVPKHKQGENNIKTSILVLGLHLI